MLRYDITNTSNQVSLSAMDVCSTALPRPIIGYRRFDIAWTVDYTRACIIVRLCFIRDS